MERTRLRKRASANTGLRYLLLFRIRSSFRFRTGNDAEKDGGNHEDDNDEAEIDNEDDAKRYGWNKDDWIRLVCFDGRNDGVDDDEDDSLIVWGKDGDVIDNDVDDDIDVTIDGEPSGVVRSYVFLGTDDVDGELYQVDNDRGRVDLTVDVDA